MRRDVFLRALRPPPTSRLIFLLQHNHGSHAGSLPLGHPEWCEQPSKRDQRLLTNTLQTLAAPLPWGTFRHPRDDHLQPSLQYDEIEQNTNAYTYRAIGGSLWHGVKGFRNSPYGERRIGAISAIKMRAPVLGGNFGGSHSPRPSPPSSFPSVRPF